MKKLLTVKYKIVINKLVDLHQDPVTKKERTMIEKDQSLVVDQLPDLPDLEAETEITEKDQENQDQRADQEVDLESSNNNF